MRLISTSTLTNQDLTPGTVGTTGLLILTYTADAERLIFVRILGAQLAGNGTYSHYRTFQIGGAGNIYRAATGTAAVPTGETTLNIVLSDIPVASGDVLKFYLIGLAGDTTTPDIVTQVWEDDGLRPTTPDRKLDVSATGEAGIDWANIGSPTTAQTLSGTSTKAVEPTTAGNKLDVSATGEAGLDFSNIKDATGSHTLTNIVVPNVTLTATTTTLTNAPADSAGVTTLLARLTTGRAGYLDLLNTYLNSSVAAVKAVVDLIQLKTDLLPSDPADESVLEAAITSAKNTILVDTAAIKAKTVNLPASPAATGAQMDLINAPNATAIAAIQNGLATAANLATVLNRLGAITGSGVNTVLGYFRALASKTVSLPADLTSGGLTYDNTTDALEALRDRGDAAWTGGGAAPTVVQIRQEIDANSTQLAAIKTKTDSLTFTVAGKVDANATHLSGDSTAADNAEAFFDGTGYAGTNNVIPTVTTLTNAPPNSSGVTTLLSIFAGWSGTLLTALQSLARKDIESADIGGTYASSTDSLEAVREQVDALAVEPAEEVNVTINELDE